MKTVLGHNHSEGTITFTFNRTFYFEQYENFSEDDMITTINFIYVVSVHSYMSQCNNKCSVDCIRSCG